MPKAIFVVMAEAPDGITRMIGRATSVIYATTIAEKWAGEHLDWRSIGGKSAAMTSSGEWLTIEMPPMREEAPKDNPLDFPRWDYVLDSRAFERYLAPELGLPLTKYGEVKEAARRAFHPVWIEIRNWIEIALGQKGIDPGHPDTGAIYPSDVAELAEWARDSGEVWSAALSVALRTMAESEDRQ